MRFIVSFVLKMNNQKTHAIAGLFTPYLRGIYSNSEIPQFNIRTPLLMYLANRERCGKDYSAGITGIVFEGVPAELTAISTSGKNDNEELRKKILSLMMQGSKRMHFANNKGKSIMQF